MEPFRPTHHIPQSIPAWEQPDPASAPVAQVDPGLQVQLLESSGDWAQVRFDNGWTGWVDGRWLAPLNAPWPTTAPSATAYFATPAAARAHPRSASPFDVLETRTWVGLAGAALVLLSAFLPWLRGPFGGADPFDVPFGALLSDTGGGPDLGLVLLVLAVAGAACLWFVAGRSGELAALGVGVAVALIVLAWIVRVQDSLSEGGPEAPGLASLLGLGLLVALAGAGALAAGRARLQTA